MFQWFTQRILRLKRLFISCGWDFQFHLFAHFHFRAVSSRSNIKKYNKNWNLVIKIFVNVWLVFGPCKVTAILILNKSNKTLDWSIFFYPLYVTNEQIHIIIIIIRGVRSRCLLRLLVYGTVKVRINKHKLGTKTLPDLEGDLNSIALYFLNKNACYVVLHAVN